MSKDDFKRMILQGIPEILPAPAVYENNINHAPIRKQILSNEQKKLALINALRYFPTKFHAELAPEFKYELETYGRIYMYRFRPNYEIFSRDISWFPHKSIQAAAIMLMISNNLDYAV
ncbi:MAG: urocanate hydratase, partial [Bacteroidales bacterium]|nr:urocanate hydratase [Bacteroidales bacterium]